MTTEPTNPQETTMTDKDTATLEQMQDITATINRLYGERAELGRSLPPVRYGDLIADGCNFLDRAFERDVEEFMQKHLTPIDTPLLDRDDFEKWELLTPRYELRATFIETRDSDEEEAWCIFDHDTGHLVTEADEEGEEVPLYFAFESDAESARDDLEREDEQSRYGFPFAWNTGWVVEDTYWLDELRSAGFLVYRYDGDAVIAGIDGGGYSFKGAHFAPLYAALAAKNGWMVRTNAGPRYLTLK